VDAAGPRWSRAPTPGSARPAAAADAEPAAPDGQELRQYPAETLETTLELLGTASATDGALHAFRVALRREDRLAERLASAAQWLGVSARRRTARWAQRAGPPGARAAVGARRARARRLAGPAARPERARRAVGGRARLRGSGAAGRSSCASCRVRRGRRLRRAALVERGGLALVQAAGRRAPRGGAGAPGAARWSASGASCGVGGAEACAHVNWHEAQAWCRWAGRRLPAELEWERAATAAAPRGFAWGDVREWAAGSARLWPLARGLAVSGFRAPDPARGWRVLRGASSWVGPRDVQLRGPLLHRPDPRRGLFRLPVLRRLIPGFSLRKAIRVSPCPEGVARHGRLQDAGRRRPGPRATKEYRSERTCPSP
jgi:hypothetical protein